MVRSVSLARIQWSARAPRHALVLASGVVVVTSVAGFARGNEPTAPPARTSEPVRAAAVEGVAELFADAYLGTTDLDARARQLAGLGYVAAATDAASSGHAPTPVLSTAVIGSKAVRRGDWSVTVAARRPSGVTFIRVEISVDRQGRLSIPRPPALVGPPVARRSDVREPEVDVEDRTLRAAVARVVRHYLAGQRDELSADLAAGVQTSPPATSFRLDRVVSTTWVSPARRVAVELLARARNGQQLTLRYELPVVRVSGRWLVTGVDTPTTDREVTP